MSSGWNCRKCENSAYRANNRLHWIVYLIIIYAYKKTDKCGGKYGF